MARRVKRSQVKSGWAPAWWVAPLLALVLAGAIVAAFSSSFSGRFIFDDIPSIENNPNLRSLKALPRVLDLTPDTEPGVTVFARPILSLSLALNYAFGGANPWSYHLLNLLIHLANAGLIFFLVAASARDLWRKDTGCSLCLGFSVALLWALHPLTTAAVTYVVQRAESLGAMWMLCGLSASLLAVRDSGVPARVLWMTVAVVSALLGNATKESAGVLPLAIMLYDRSFVFRSWSEAWRRRKVFYLVLGATWVFLAWLIFEGKARSGTVGFEGGIRTFDYLMVQGWAIAHYLFTALFPFGQVFDYGEGLPITPAAAIPWAILTAFLGLGALVLWWKRPAYGYAAVLFFLLLGPTSSIIPVQTHPVAEHRMYLPLACVMILVLSPFFVPPLDSPSAWTRRIAVLGLLAVGLGCLTFRRNLDYASPETLWRQSWRQNLLNWRASNNYGAILEREGRWDEVIGVYRETLENFRALNRRDEYFLRANENLGYALLAIHREAEAEPYLREVVNRGKNISALTFNNLGLVLTKQKKWDEAERWFKRAQERDPKYAAAASNLGWLYLKSGRTDNAILWFERALQLQTDSEIALTGLGVAWAKSGQPTKSRSAFEKAAALRPDNPEVFNNFGAILADQGETALAVENFQRALELKPAFPGALVNLRKASLALDQGAVALNYAWKAVQSDPGSTALRLELVNCAMGARQPAEAIRALQEGLALKPGELSLEKQLGLVLLSEKRVQDAVPHLEIVAERSNPPDLGVLNNLAWIIATDSDPGVRNGAKAEMLARRALAAQPGNPVINATLAAALAEQGQFDEAIRGLERARQLSIEQGNSDFMQELDARLLNYRMGKTWRE